MEFIDPNIQEYCNNHSDAESELLREINRDTHANVLSPRMLSGHFQGRLLSMISKMIRPECILEIGTYTGYSALCMAEGLAEDGQLITIDINEELESRVRASFEKSGYAGQIDFRIGNALDIIPKINRSLDLVFIDADKQNYLNYYHLVMQKLRPGGFILTDNVLWSGKVVAEEVKASDKQTRAIMEFNDFVHQDDKVENVLLPVRDGIMLVRKK